VAFVNSLAVKGSLLSLNWHIYLIECADGSLYAGITIDIERWFREHLSGKGARYTCSHTRLRLLTSQPFDS